MTSLIGVSASNNFLPLFIVIKGKKIPVDLQQFEDPQVVITSSENAWITEETFIQWIDRVWKPYTHHFTRSLLIMDQYRVHKTDRVLSLLQENKTDVVFVPTGLTFFSQPCDVYVNKPLKEKVKNLWQDHMLNQKDTSGNLT